MNSTYVIILHIPFTIIKLTNTTYKTPSRGNPLEEFMGGVQLFIPTTYNSNHKLQLYKLNFPLSRCVTWLSISLPSLSSEHQDICLQSFWQYFRHYHLSGGFKGSKCKQKSYSIYCNQLCFQNFAFRRVIWRQVCVCDQPPQKSILVVHRRQCQEGCSKTTGLSVWVSLSYYYLLPSFSFHQFILFHMLLSLSSGSAIFPDYIKQSWIPP